MKLENIAHHNYFCLTVYEITKQIGLHYSYSDIEKKVLDDEYLCYFPKAKNTKWYLGIWAVGQWNLKTKSSLSGELIEAGYDLDGQKPLTICVFLIHKWDLDKFRPSFANWSKYINKPEDGSLPDSTHVIDELNWFIKNPIQSYYNYVDNYWGDKHEGNMYTIYTKALWNDDFIPFLSRYIRRAIGFINMLVLVFCAKLDPRVNHIKHRYHPDKWNQEFDVAIVFKYRTLWKDWKIYQDYRKLLFYRENCELSMDYCEDDEKFNIRFWRGCWWQSEPAKNAEYTFTKIEEPEQEDNKE